MKFLLNFAYCIVVNEVFACVAGASSLLGGGVLEGGYSLCLLGAVAVLVQAVVFLHASGGQCGVV